MVRFALQPFDLAHVEGHPALRKIVRCTAPETPEFPGKQWDNRFGSIVLHSTSEWARAQMPVSGTKSAIAKFVGPQSDEQAARVMNFESSRQWFR